MSEHDINVKSGAILVLAPIGRDAEGASFVLGKSGIGCQTCPSFQGMYENIGENTELLMIAEEALNEEKLSLLSTRLADQPIWSDIPIIILSRGTSSQIPIRSSTARLAEALSNVMFLERPLHALTLVSAVKTAIKARQKQYQIRDYLIEREQAAEALKESGAQFQLLAESIPQLAWMANAAGEIFWYNQRWYDYTGKTLEDAQGWGWQSVHDPNILPDVLASWHLSLNTGQPFEMVFPLRRADGVFCTFLTRVLPLRDAQGNVVRWFGTNTDVNELRDTQKALQESELMFRTITEASPSGLWMSDTTGQCVYVNKVWEEMAGFALDTIKYRDWSDYVDPRDRPAVLEGFTQAFAEQKPYAAEFRTVLHRWQLATGRPRYDSDGNFAGFVGANADITERKEVEEALFQSQQKLKEYATKLEQSNKELEHFAAIASHDLQAPLRKILIFSDILYSTEGERLSVEGKDYVERIQKTSARMQDLISDLLNLSRVTRQGKQFQQVELSDIIQRAIDDSQRELDNQIDVQDTGCSLLADPNQLQQVFQNLIENALKFHRQGIPALIKISAVQLPGFCQISISDNGIGIKEEYLERIFDTFQRLHAVSEYPGTGIGLSIVKKIVERHGGTIRATSTPGEGTTFIIQLPYAPIVAESSPMGATLFS
jgi:PAS domain S-box-containing protein